MAWSAFSKENIVRALESLVHEAVTHYRNRGHKAEHAIEQAALALGMTPRRTRAFYYGEAFSADAAEYKRVRAAFLRLLDAQADDLAKRSEAARARRRQMELGI